MSCDALTPRTWADDDKRNEEWNDIVKTGTSGTTDTRNYGSHVDNYNWKQVVTLESRTGPTRWKILESFSTEVKPSWARREVPLRLWFNGSFGSWTTFQKETKPWTPLFISALWIWTTVQFRPSSSLHLFGTFLLLTWLSRRSLCVLFVPRLVVYYMATMEREEGHKIKDVTSGFCYVHWFLKVLDCIKAFSCMIRETTESGIYYLQSNTKDRLVSVHRQRRSS